MCIAVMKEMNHIFKEENVDAEVVLYEVGDTMETVRERSSFVVVLDAGSTDG